MAITAFQRKRDGNHSFPVGGRAQSQTAWVQRLGDRHDQNSKWNGCSGWLARWGAPDRSICAARGNPSTARRLHGGRPDVVQLGDPEQGTHSDLLGVEDGPAFAEVPGAVCQALTDRLTGVRLTRGRSRSNFRMRFICVPGRDRAHPRRKAKARRQMLGHLVPTGFAATD
jgi:hypothetical protein